MNTQIEKRKITVQLWRPLLDKLNERTTEACLNRDAYLNVVLAHEAAMLVSELGGKQNSTSAKTFLKRCFAELKDFKPVSFTLTTETADALTQACDQCNVWRDSFVNRVIYLLLAKSFVIEREFHFKFDDCHHEIFYDGEDVKSLLIEPRLVGVCNFIREAPFRAIRDALRSERPDTCGRLHALPLGSPHRDTKEDRGLAGFTVYLDDKDVPNTDAWHQEMAVLASMDF